MAEQPTLIEALHDRYTTNDTLYTLGGTAIWDAVMGDGSTEELDAAHRALRRITASETAKNTHLHDYYNAQALLAHAPLHQLWATGESATPEAVQETHQSLGIM